MSNLQEQIKNLRVGDRVRVDGYGCNSKGEVIQPSSDSLVTVSEVAVSDRADAPKLFRGVTSGHNIAKFYRSSIVEVIPAKAEESCYHCETCRRDCKGNTVCCHCKRHRPMCPCNTCCPPKSLPVCGYCKTRCHEGASDEVGAVCHNSVDGYHRVRRASGWARHSRCSMPDRRKITGPLILRPGVLVECHGYGMGAITGKLFCGERYALKEQCGAFWNLEYPYESRVLIHARNLDPIERRKGDRRKS